MSLHYTLDGPGRALLAQWTPAIRSEVEHARGEFSRWQDVTLYHCGVSVRTNNCLWNTYGSPNDITLEFLHNLRDSELLRIPNFGRKSLRELRVCIAGFSMFWNPTVREAVESETDGELERMMQDAAKWRELLAWIESRR